MQDDEACMSAAVKMSLGSQSLASHVDIAALILQVRPNCLSQAVLQWWHHD